MDYRTVTFKEYRDTPLEEIPMDYLVWMFTALKDTKEFKPFYEEVLAYFLTKDVRVEKSADNIYYFFFNDYLNPEAVDGERAFLHSYWGMENSKGELVYEIGPIKSPYYIEKVGKHFEISNKYVSHKYRFGGIKMIYEINPEYYFIDAHGMIMNGAFLIRKPWIPHGAYLARDFSENLLIEELNKQK
jgi:hypothetical protein